MKSAFLPVPTKGLTPVSNFGSTFHVPEGPDGAWNDYAAWAAVPAIAMLEVVVFGVGTLMLFLALMSSSISVPSYATYGTLMATIQAATLTAMYVFLGNFSRRTDTNKAPVGYAYAHALYTDLMRAAGYTIAGLFAVFQLKSMCNQEGFLDDKGLIILVVFIGMAAGVVFKLAYNDGALALAARPAAPSDRSRVRVPGEIKTRGETLGLWFWLLPIMWMAAFILVFIDVILAADGSPLASRIYFVASFGLVYMIAPTALTIWGMFTVEATKSGDMFLPEAVNEASVFNRYTSGIKALVYCAADFLVFGTLVFGTAFAAVGSPFRDLDMFLLPAPTVSGP